MYRRNGTTLHLELSDTYTRITMYYQLLLQCFANYSMDLTEF